VTFLFTDIEGSTPRWMQHPAAMRAALARHDALLHAGIAAHGGVVLTERGEGDSFFALFARASDAVAAACALQRALAAEPWPEAVAPIRVRMALHTGESGLHEGWDHRGAAVNRCARLRAIAHGGQVLLSGATYELVRDVLPPAASLRALGAHCLKGLTRPEQVYQLVHPDLPAGFRPLKTLDVHCHNLPVQLTPFIGREREVTAVRERLLDPQTRLLTLTGPGGTGKTRLALQVAAEVLEAFPDGVFFVNLAPINDPALVLPTIAQALEVTESGGRPLREVLHALLRAKQLLLILDNCEQVVGAAPAVADLLAASPRLRVLATSRALLRVQGERAYAVGPLALPDTAPLPPLETLTQYEAVRLFIARARDVRPDFAVTNATAPAVAEICMRLDGLPLAIELAAARVKLLAPPALLARLTKRLPLLTGGARDLPARHRTLRGTIAWSYDLLDPAEQALFRRLGVFVGGWTLEAAEVVCGGNEGDVLDLLGVLLDKSLVRVEAQGVGEDRYSLLETIREYALERLEGSGEASELRRAHAEHYLALAEDAGPMLKGPDQAAWLERLEREHDNLRAALGFLWASGDGERALRLAGALGRFWDLQGHWSEGRRRLNDLLALPAPAGHPATEASTDGQVRVAALNVAALLAAEQHDYERARALAEASAVLARSTDDVPGLIDALEVLEQEAFFGRFALAEARDLATQSVTLARSIADDWRTAGALHRLAHVVYHDGDYVRAAALWEEGEARYRLCGDPAGRARVLCWLAGLLCDRGDVAQGVAHLRDALALLRGTHPSMDRARAMYFLAIGLLEQSAYREAEALIEQALAIYQTVGAPSMAARCHTELGRLALVLGDDQRAETLLKTSLRQARSAGALFGAVVALLAQGDLLTYRGLHDRADEAYRESLQLVEPMHMPQPTARVLQHFGVLAQRQGNLALARERLERAMTLVQGRTRLVHASLLTALGRVAADEGDLDEARRCLLESLGMERVMGRPREIAEALEGLAAVAVAQGRPERAVRSGAAAAGIRASIGAPLSPYERAAFERTLDAARVSLGANTVGTTWTSAQAVPWEQIVDEVLASP
jgi:predicted ATPase/class 3 adenylate cyclase/Tfp pilus assembly protein PilF